jgi:peptide/nickel transport system permease protein
MAGPRGPKHAAHRRGDIVLTMTAYLLRRVLLMIPVALFLTLILFVVLRLSPGDPAQVMLGEQVTPETVAALHHQLGLDKPLPAQYVIWLGRIARGDFGRSLSNGQPVLTAVGERLPATAELGIAALGLQIVVALTLGIFAAVKRRSLIGPATTLLASVFFSLPSFFFAVLLVLVFAVTLHLLPVSGYAPLTGPDGDIAANLRHLVLPVLALAIPEAAALARLVRSSLTESLQADYVRTARSKGLPDNVIVTRHAMRNAALPLITSFGLSLALLFSGAVLIETIFSWPGIGRLAVSALQSRDYPTVEGIVLLSALAVMGVNLFADIAYAVADPRISYGRRSAS